MTTIHDEIDELLAADLHEQLSETERNELHAHLIECAECRQLHKEHQLMNTILNDTFEEAKPDLKFEQRMLGRFRDRVPDRGPGVMRFLLLAMRSRATQIAAAAAVLFALVQTGRMITGEGTMPSRSRVDMAARDTAHMQPAATNTAATDGFTDRVAKAASASGARSSFAPPPPFPASV